jgi:CCR4-NOT transcription complex subunit 6
MALIRFTLKVKEEVEYGRRIQDYLKDPLFTQRINSKFLFNFAKRDHVALFCLFEEKDTKRQVVVANTHLYWRPDHTAIKTIQAKMLMKSLQQFFDHNKLNIEETPIVLCGDFNSKPTSGVYNFIVNGELDSQSPDLTFDDNGTQRVAWERGIQHRLNLKSVYGNTIGEPWTTNHTST